MRKPDTYSIWPDLCVGPSNLELLDSMSQRRLPETVARSEELNLPTTALAKGCNSKWETRLLSPNSAV